MRESARKALFRSGLVIALRSTRAASSAQGKGVWREMEGGEIGAQCNPVPTLTTNRQLKAVRQQAWEGNYSSKFLWTSELGRPYVNTEGKQPCHLLRRGKLLCHPIRHPRPGSITPL
jgi:hypothetical protein